MNDPPLNQTTGADGFSRISDSLSSLDGAHRRFEEDGEVVSHERIIGVEYEIIFYSPQIARAARPGQFLELLFGDSYAPLLRRPFSLYRVDREEGTLSVLYLARGSFTSGLAQMKPGDRASLLGPLGNPFSYPQDSAACHILIAGGIGVPPIYFLARELAGEFCGGVVVINAARTVDRLVGVLEFGALEIEHSIVTEDGSHGIAGIATDHLVSLLDSNTVNHKQTYLYACGPMPMLRAIGNIAIERNLPCQLSIETYMPCGIGICQGCAVPIHKPDHSDGLSYALACVDGPVFEAKTLVW